MADLLASGKTGEQRYEDNNADKPVPDLDLITLTQNLKSSLQQTRGWSLSNEKGSSESQAPQLSIIDEANVDDYSTALPQMIQTFVSNDSYLDLDPASTANNLILIPRKIGNENSPNGTNYSENTSLPFKYRDNLKFTFRAALNNTGPVQVSIPALSGLSGAIDIVNELGTNSVTIVQNKFYEIVLTGASGTKEAIIKNIGASLAEAIAGTDNTKFLTPYLASNLPAFRAAMQTPRNLTHLVATKITGFVVDYDIGNYWNAGSSRYTPPAGKYKVNVIANGICANDFAMIWGIYLNGNPTVYNSIIGYSKGNAGIKLPNNQTITVNGTDYLEVFVTMNYASPATLTLNELFLEIEKER